MARVVLVTGVSRYLGGLLARRLAADPGVERVVGVDVIPPPHDIGDVEFVRADIRNPMIGRVIESSGVDTVVHMNVIATPTFVGGRLPQKEINVIGTMQLLAACQKSSTVERLVVKSSAAVYGSTSRDPALFTEDMGARRTPSGGFGKDSIEVEGYVRGFARRRPDTEILMLRFANVIGPRIRTSVTDYFSLPVVPVPLGYDARMQFVHEDDAIDALVLAGTGDATGVVNVAGDGVVTVLQATAIAQRPVLPIPLQSAGLVGGITRRLGLVDFTPDQMSFLAFGRGLDTARMREVLGFEPRWTSREAFAAFAATLGAAVPGAQAVTDAVSGVAGTASSAVLRALGAGSGR
ncbi:NAD-dependent epimerase/dehydratase family protein [Phycicoccus sp. CSK15P-2]|uniref:NAD-dependent epimerase/dehydratase family protein n=1 Tax=Phycicoccus sp. CSK15P-2 TaxID=2807627 RepID=UPI001951C8B1|nr:NAD-dependent epimerase/dehydratase family protein [Phycicoccus sp. CSK15P-2]MBM6406132.1 NAD-dependent epimerase/dehydratase family protein [Phycicoccus sp. CSK15P-2]